MLKQAIKISAEINRNYSDMEKRTAKKCSDRIKTSNALGGRDNFK